MPLRTDVNRRQDRLTEEEKEGGDEDEDEDEVGGEVEHFVAAGQRKYQ